jgi:hypothetical protein
LEEIKQAVQHVGEARQRSYGWQQSLGGRKPVSGVVRPMYRAGPPRLQLNEQNEANGNGLRKRID